MSFRSLGILKMALRANVCEECERRDGGAAGDVPIAVDAAPCETSCPVFVHLPRLIRISRNGEPPCGYAMFGDVLRHPSAAGPDMELALAVLHRAFAIPQPTRCDPSSECKRLGRIAAEVASVPQDLRRSEETQ